MLSAVYTVCGLAITSVVSLVVVNRYFNFRIYKSYPFTIVVLVSNLLLLLVTALLLPLDLHDTAAGHPNSLLFKVIWLSIYWLQFAVCWLVIPILISYVSLKYEIPANEITTKISKSIKLNLKFYLICLIALALGLFYLILSTGHGLREVKSLLMALSHLYSLSYTLILLSTGLIILPRDILRDSLELASSDKNMNTLFVNLSKINEDMNESQLNLNESAMLILSTREQENGDIIFNDLLRDCKSEIEYKLEELKSSSLLTSPLVQISNSGNHASSSITTLEKLNKNYNDFINNYYNSMYDKVKSDEIIHKLAVLQDATLNNSKGKMVVRALSLICGIFTTLLSLLVYFLELTPTKWFHGWVFVDQKLYNFFLQLAIISYNTLASLYAMSKFKFLDFHLIPNGQSSPSNALYYSLYSSRLLFPLCFNLIALIPKHSNNSEKTPVSSIFEKVLYQNLTVIPMVNFLNKFLPLLFMTIIPLSYKFDIKQKILLKVLGEEYYYQFFGLMLYEPIGEIPSTEQDIESRHRMVPNNNGSGTITGQPRISPISMATAERSPLDEDYQYSLQDGKFLFERASNSLKQSSPQHNNPLTNIQTNSTTSDSGRLNDMPASHTYL